MHNYWFSENIKNVFWGSNLLSFNFIMRSECANEIAYSFHLEPWWNININTFHNFHSMNVLQKCRWNYSFHAIIQFSDFVQKIVSAVFVKVFIDLFLYIVHLHSGFIICSYYEKQFFDKNIKVCFYRDLIPTN